MSTIEQRIKTVLEEVKDPDRLVDDLAVLFVAMLKENMGVCEHDD